MLVDSVTGVRTVEFIMAQKSESQEEGGGPGFRKNRINGNQLFGVFNLPLSRRTNNQVKTVNNICVIRYFPVLYAAQTTSFLNTVGSQEA